MSYYPIVNLSTDALLTHLLGAQTSRSDQACSHRPDPGMPRDRGPGTDVEQRAELELHHRHRCRTASRDRRCVPPHMGLHRQVPFAVADRFNDDPARNREQRKVSDSAAYLAEHIGEVPVLMIPCVEVIDGDGTLTGENANQYWSSIMPATWSYMLAARSRGLGTTWTGVTIMADDEMRAILGLPDNVYHATTIPTAYYTGTTFRRAERIPLDDVLHFDRW